MPSLLREDLVPLVTLPASRPSLRVADPRLSQDQLDYLDASQYGSIGRGYASGRLSSDANAAFAREASLRAAGDLAAAQLARDQALGSQRRASIYAPSVGRVEDIGGVGDALSWAGGQVGQGVASMQDPMLASAALTAAGTGLTFVPNPLAKAAGYGLRNLAAPAVAYDINRKQLKGEAYGSFSADPEVMARHSAQELDDRASTYGNVAGLLDTALPGFVGRQLGGGALRGAVRPRLPMGAALGAELLGEGTTEALQELGKQAVHGELNPGRDASGDRSDVINSFLGGAVGAGGPALAGHAASSLYRAPRRAADAVTDAAGTLLNLGKGRAEESGGKAAGKTVDLGETLKAASSEKSDTSLADLNLLRGLPDDPAIADDPEKFRAWVTEMSPRRDARIRQGLADLAGKGDERAAELLAGMDSPDRATAVDATDAAGDHLIEAQGLREMAARADEALDGPRRGPAARVGDLLGRGARWVAGQAAEGAKAGWEGLTRKRNAQGPGMAADGARHAAMNAFDDAQETAQAKQRSLGRAQLMGEYLAAQAEAQAPRYKAHRVNPESMQRRLGDIGAELASLAESWGLTGQQEIAKDKRGDRFDNLKFDLGNVASELRTALGKDGAAQALEGLRQRADPGAAPLFDFLGEQLKSPGNSQAGMAEAAKALVAHVEPQTMLKLQRQGIDLTSAGAGRELVRTVQKAGRGDERALKQLDEVFGVPTANRMLDTLGMSPAEQQVESAYAEHTGPSGLRLESDSVVEDFDQNQGQKLYDKTASTRLYGFHGMPRARTDQAGRDPLVGEKDPDFGMRRPRLMPLNDSAAIETSTKRLQKQLGDDPAWSFAPKSALQVMADHEGISLQTALAGRLGGNALSEGTKDGQAEKLGVNPAFVNKLMARYRDYMRQEAARSRESDPERAAALTKRMKRASDVLLDRMEQAEGRAPSRTTAGQRDDMLSRAIEYMSTHGMVVAERGTDRDPQQISVEQVMAMIDKAERMTSAAERNGETMNDVLHFQSRLANSKKEGPGPVKILAGDVAKFAREARKTLAGGEDRSSSVNANEQYLRDLSDGIAALVASGHVEGLPRGFSDNKMPENLPLRTMTYGTWQKAKAKRVEERRASASKQEVEGGGDARKSERNQKAVAGEQAREHFVPDDTALPQRSDADEFEGQQRETRAAGMDARELPKEVQARTFPRMSMASRGPRLGAQLHAEMLASFDDGLSQARTYLNQAADKMPQYLSPVAHALSGERFEQLGTTPAEKAAVKALRAETARLLAASNLSQSQKVDLARTLAKPEGRAKVTAQNVKTFLERAGQTSAEKIEAPAPKPAMTKAQRDAESTRAVADWDGPVRKLNAQALGLHAELKRPGFGAAHNSPIKHEGRFDWRKNLGKGEGAWVYGAGTYLSTADNVHKFYKKQFTKAYQAELSERDSRLGQISDKIADLQNTIPDLAADLAEARDGLDGTDFARAAFNVAKRKLDAAKSEVANLQAQYDARVAELGTAAKAPTYHVSVDIGQDRILDWNKPLADQHASIRLRAMKAIKEHQLDLDLSATGERLYKALATKLQFDAEDATNSFKEASEVPDGNILASDYLQSLGILGHKYIGGSRGEGHNYVIYDDSKIHTNFVAFNAQDLGRAATPEEMQQARDYVEKVLGPQVKVDFEKLTGYSGEWLEHENVIKISTTPGPGAMQVAYHEALHAFFSKFIKSDPKALDVFKTLVDDPKLLERLRGLLADHPAALEQLKHREEVLAYAYQFWAADMLDLPTKPRTLFGKIQRFFRQVLGRISDQERAAAILEAFHDGKMSEPSAAGQVITKALGEGTLTPRTMRKLDAVVSKVRELTYPSQSVLATSMSLTAQKLAPMFWTNPGAEAHGADTGEGYINAKEASATKYKNLLSGYIQGLSDRDLRDVASLLQAGTDPAKIPYAPHAEAVKNIRQLLERFHEYMTKERGLEIGKLENYFPRVWNVSALLEKQGEFVDMLLAKYDHVLADGARSSGLTKVQVAQRIFDKLVSNSVGEHALPDRDDGVLAPFFASAMNRELRWLKQEDSAPYESKDLIGTLTGYFHSGARAAEYAHRFGNNGEILAKMLGQVDEEFKAAAAQLVKKGELKQPEAEKWAARRSAEVRKAVGAMEGTLGKDISSTWRNASAWMTTYQNIRLLPLTLFSSVVDPLGMVARGATMKEAYDTFLRGMREVGTSWADMIKSQPKERQADEWERLAMAVGSVDAAMFSHHVADEYSSMYMNKKAKRLNDAFFRINGMEAWNRGVRVGATQAAVAFITKHAQLPDKTHSARWLKELGLTPADLTFDDEGKLITHKNELAAKKGIPVDQAEREMEKVHYAIRRWVQGAVLTPNAAQRPSWSSDPHWSFMFHLKQFSYSFHQTLLKRAVNELNYGNLAPIGSFAWYIPVMIASDVMRGLVQGGGSLPAHMKGLDAGDWVMRGINRSGLLSVGAIGVDATHDLSSLAGPAIEQVIDSFGQPLGKTVVDALPAHGLYAQAIS